MADGQMRFVLAGFDQFANRKSATCPLPAPPAATAPPPPLRRLSQQHACSAFRAAADRLLETSVCRGRGCAPPSLRSCARATLHSSRWRAATHAVPAISRWQAFHQSEKRFLAD